MQIWNYMKSPITITCLVISKLLLLALPIAQIAIGAVYLQDCPQQYYIPVYVLVCGVFSVFLDLLSCLPCAREAKEGGHTMLHRTCNAWNSLVSTFLLCWMICGSVWIYSIYPPNYNQTVTGEPYCNKTLYLFAFWTTTLAYIALGLALLSGCCVCICACICCASSGVEAQHERVRGDGGVLENE
ncbi:transmembrane protein 272-like [Onychostoma macrolepis]|uniref:transmembrane protein 272-like n=1 Tax=Onychostoma macrolepis TaxID=369639 RepID=UPI00272CA45A|nr:transmembrane protein 272-like [Onychostoma macrolepis]